MNRLLIFLLFEVPISPIQLWFLSLCLLDIVSFLRYLWFEPHLFLQYDCSTSIYFFSDGYSSSSSGHFHSPPCHSWTPPPLLLFYHTPLDRFFIPEAFNFHASPDTLTLTSGRHKIAVFAPLNTCSSLPMHHMLPFQPASMHLTVPLSIFNV